MVLSTEYPLDKNTQATSGGESRSRDTSSSIIEYVNGILGYDVSMALVEMYARLAVRNATMRQLENNEYFAEVGDMPGVWASGATEADALKELKEVVEDWARLKIQDGDKDLPIVGGINLNVL